MMKLVIGNWKMYPTLSDSLVLASSLKGRLENVKGVEVVIAPPLPWLVPIIEHWKHRPRNLHFGVQNIWPDDQGAFTGEISAYMVKNLASYVILGHSERRRYSHESDELINAKIHSALRWRLKPVLCVGEATTRSNQEKITASERNLLAEQLKEGLSGVKKEQLENIVIAYEPLWAIGTHHAVSPEYAHQVISLLREIIADKYGQAAPSTMRFLYGGSVDQKNVEGFMREKGIDGFLVGTASVKAKEFGEICEIVSSLK